jgi:hypothetical protein
VRQLPDGELLLLARDGRRSAAVELWRRHTAYTMAVAHGLAPNDDWESINTRAWTLVLDPGADDKAAGGFRPYVYFMIRALSSVEEPTRRREDFLTAAYHDLPPRWHETLWYSHIELMRPARIARLMGLDPDSMPQLLHRARQGLRQEWVRHHVAAIAEDSDCRLVWEYSGAYIRGVLTTQERTWMEDHLATCPVCRHAGSDAIAVASHLPAIVLPTIAGNAGAANLLDYLRTNGSAVRSSLDLPAGVERLFSVHRRTGRPTSSDTAQDDASPENQPPSMVSDAAPADQQAAAAPEETGEAGQVGSDARSPSVSPTGSTPVQLSRPAPRPARLEQLVLQVTRSDPGELTQAQVRVGDATATQADVDTDHIPATPDRATTPSTSDDHTPGTPGATATEPSRASTILPPVTVTAGPPDPRVRVDPDEEDDGDDDVEDIPPAPSAISETRSINRLTGQEKDLAHPPATRRHTQARLMISVAVALITVAAIVLAMTRPWQSRQPVTPTVSDTVGSASIPSPLQITAVDTGPNNTLLPLVTGVAPAGTEVTVQIGDATASVVAGDDGRWTTASQPNFTGLTRGQITVSARDLPGPTTAVYQIAEPPVLTTDQANPSIVTLSGLPNSSVEVLIDGNPATIWTLDGAGTTTGTLTPQPGNRFLQARYVADARFGASSEALAVIIT